jgi:hypothetical protein
MVAGSRKKISAFFHEKYELSANSLLPISMGTENPLYSNNQNETRVNNRTISLRIIPTIISRGGAGCARPTRPDSWRCLPFQA